VCNSSIKIHHIVIFVLESRGASEGHVPPSPPLSLDPPCQFVGGTIASIHCAAQSGPPNVFVVSVPSRSTDRDIQTQNNYRIWVNDRPGGAKKGKVPLYKLLPSLPQVTPFELIAVHPLRVRFPLGLASVHPSPQSLYIPFRVRDQDKIPAMVLGEDIVQLVVFKIRNVLVVHVLSF
jgi:hypothetical protein